MKKSKKYRKFLKDCIKQRKQVYISRTKLKDEHMSAIPAKISRQLLLVQYLLDFHVDGFKVIRLSDLTDIRRNEIEIFHDEIMEKEGLLDTLYVPDVAIDDWKDFFASIMKMDKMVAVSLERKEKGRSFFLGKVKKVKEKSIQLLYMDVYGDYEEKTTKICYKDITLVDFDDRYSEMYDKYGRKEIG